MLSSSTHDSGTDRDGLHSNCDGLMDFIEKCTLSPSADLTTIMTSFTIQWTGEVVVVLHGWQYDGASNCRCGTIATSRQLSGNKVAIQIKLCSQ